MALRPLPFGDFLTVPFRAMRFNRAAVVGAPMLMFMFSLLITGAAIWIAATDSGVSAAFDPTSSVSLNPRFETVVAVIVAVVVWVLSDTVSSAVVVPAVAQAALGNKLTVGEALRATLNRMGALIGLAFLALLASAAVVTLVCAPLLIDASTGGDGAAGFGFTVLLVFLLGLPGLVVISVYLPVARGVVMMERHGPFTAIRRAIALVPGRFWWTVLILLVLGAINGAVQQVFGIVTQMVAMVVALLTPNTDSGFAIALIAAYVFQMVASVVAQYSFVGSAMALVYLDMRFRKEGLAFDMARTAEAHHAAYAGRMS